MKLGEIKTVVPQTKNLINYESFDYSKEEKLGIVDSHDVFKIPGKTNGQFLFRIKADNKPAVDLFAVQNTTGAKRLFVRFVWTYPNFRKRGFAIAIYKALYQDFGFSLVSDNQLAKGTLHIWLKYLKGLGSLKVFDTKTHREIDIEPEKAVNDESLLFVLEGFSLYPLTITEGKYAGMTIPASGNGLISDYHRFIDCKEFYE